MMYQFKHPVSRPVSVFAKSSEDAWVKLYRTHGFHMSDRKDWHLASQRETPKRNLRGKRS